MTEEHLERVYRSLYDLKNLDGLETITRMKDSGSKNYKQSEWIGFFIEEKISNILCGDFPDIYKYQFYKNGRTTIDLFDNIPIDIKTHSFGKEATPLNDKETIEKIINGFGEFGILLITHIPILDNDFSFYDQFQEIKGEKSEYQKKNEANNVRKRKLKKSTTLSNMKLINIDTFDFLDTFSQGRNSNGRDRKLKCNLIISRIPEKNILYDRDFN